ncbi:MAG: hypothetical protein IJJ77_10690 [Paludibacteraceae bacterium]|nr:hypothetical protein [Paludibacteraceae bacterium]
MKKFLLSVMVFMLAIIASALTYMQVKTTDGQIVRYNVDEIKQIDFEKDATTSTMYMCMKTNDGKVDKYDVEKVMEVSCLEDTIVYDTTGTVAQGVSVSGKMNEYTFVDLGLESGLLWATYNVGATKPTESGDYFAWGETKTKDMYNSSNYKWYEGSSTSVSKYYYKRKFGEIYLEPEDDAAIVNWGYPWHMPSRQDLKEMVDGCDWEWTEDFNGSGMAGIVGTSKNNNNTIFFPASGVVQADVTCNWNHACWASSIHNSYYYNDADIFIYDNKRHDVGNGGQREYGRAVRAVVDTKSRNTVNFYYSDSTTLIERQKIIDGGTATVPVAPQIADYEFVGWSDSSFTDIHNDLNFYAVYKKIVITTTISGEIGEHSYVDLGLPSGLKWATCNIGATKPEEYGDYIAWGETSPKVDYYWTNLKYSLDAGDHFSKYVEDRSFGSVDSLSVLEPEDDAAVVNWGEEWYTPTSEDYRELIEGCDWKWVKDFNETGITGRLGVSKTNGNIIFFPAGGYRDDEGLEEIDKTGLYWASTITRYSYWSNSFEINAQQNSSTSSARYFGANIRPVAK